MKRIIKIFFIVYLFFASLCVNAMDLSLHLPNQANSIQTLDNKKTIYSTQTSSEKFLVSTNHSETSILLQRRDTSNFNFNGLKNEITANSSQFLLLVSYIYNKSYLGSKIAIGEKKFLTEISPNAP